MFRAYINESFLVKPKPGCADYKNRHADWAELSFLLKLMLQYEVYDNMRLSPSLGDPSDFIKDPSGRLGADTVLSVFMIPLKIKEIVMSRVPHAKNIKVLAISVL